MSDIELATPTELVPGGETYENRRLYSLPLDSLIPDPHQPRKHFDAAAMEELKTSIGKYGVLQPVIFRKDAEGRLVIVSGERRYRACRQAGKGAIPAIYNEGGNAAEIALVENLLRENLNPIEEAEALKKLKDEQDYKNTEISAAIGKAVSTISEILSLNNLPESVKQECRANPRVSRRALVEIVKARSEEEMEALFQKYKKKELKSDEVRTQTRGKKPLHTVWEKKIGDFHAQLVEVELAELGHGRSVVEDKLQELEGAIRTKLATNEEVRRAEV